nr:hypothetical protein [Tanacetum cinerariifolium]
MYRSSFNSPSPQPNQGYSPLRINLEMDIENLFGTQEYYAGQGSGQCSSATQDYYTGQDYSMGHCSGQGSGMAGPSDPAEHESPVKEVPPVKGKKVSKRHQKVKMTINKEASKNMDNSKRGRVGSKKSRTPETTSHGISDSAHDDLNLNEEANGDEFREVQPIVRDRAKKKASFSSSFESSSC